MIRNVTFEETTYSDPPAKFEAGTPNIADAVGLGAALDYVNQVGIHNIGQYEHSLLHYGTERLSMINDQWAAHHRDRSRKSQRHLLCAG